MSKLSRCQYFIQCRVEWSLTEIKNNHSRKKFHKIDQDPNTSRVILSCNSALSETKIEFRIEAQSQYLKR